MSMTGPRFPQMPSDLARALYAEEVARRKAARDAANAAIDAARDILKADSERRRLAPINVGRAATPRPAKPAARVERVHPRGRFPALEPTADGRCGNCRARPVRSRGRCSWCYEYVRRRGRERSLA